MSSDQSKNSLDEYSTELAEINKHLENMCQEFHSHLSDMKSKFSRGVAPKKAKSRSFASVTATSIVGSIPIIGPSIQPLVRAGVDEYIATKSLKREEEKMWNIIKVSSFDGDTASKEFNLIIKQGLALICVAFKDQILKFTKHDASRINFYRDCIHRIFDYISKNPREDIDPKYIFLAFLKGRSVQGPFLFKTEKNRGLAIECDSQKFSTREVFEDVGLITVFEGLDENIISLYRKEKQKAETKIGGNLFFRYVHPFEFSEFENVLQGYTECKLQYLEVFQNTDWRARPGLVELYLNSIQQSEIEKEGLVSEKTDVDLLQKPEMLQEKHKVQQGCSKNVVFVEKWWPEEKQLAKAFLDRKVGSCLLVNQLRKQLLENENRITVINQKVAVSGLGGVGKTATAKWYAKYYAEQYDKIIWLDCGETSVIKSISNLARDLGIQNRNDFEVHELAKKAFTILSDFKCLIIYDNAESYVGSQGIKSILTNEKNFHTIITSRNREWGSENGDGRIAEFQLDVFDIADSIEFLKKNLPFYSDGKFENRLHEVCQLLGNLPLALQIAVATLNRHKIDLDEYILRIKNTDHIINKNFDDYEKTINKTMTISLDMIKNDEQDAKKLAYQFLLIFGYIIPDKVDCKFFQGVEKSDLSDTYEAVELLEKYSLVSISTDDQNGVSSVSIHRLLQQVIRHNGKDTESDTLRKIFNCSGFFKYKLIPYTMYADESLQKEFPAIRAQLLDQIHIENLIREEKFNEAQELAMNINSVLKTQTSRYNYAVCLEKNGELSKALNEFQCLFADTKFATLRNDIIGKSGIMKLVERPCRQIVAGRMFLIYAKQNILELTEGENMFTSLRDIAMKLSENFEIFFEYFSKVAKYFPNYSVNCDDQWISLQTIPLDSIESHGHCNQIKMNDIALIDLFVVPSDVRHLELKSVEFCHMAGDCEFLSNFLIDLNTHTISTLHISNCEVNISWPLLYRIENIYLENCNIISIDITLSPKSIELNDCCYEHEDKIISINDILKFDKMISIALRCWEQKNVQIYLDDQFFSIKSVFLGGCKVFLSDAIIYPSDIGLHDIIVIRDHNEVDTVVVNEFVHFQDQNRISLRGENLALDLNGKASVKFLRLEKSRVLNWENSKWHVDKFVVFQYYSGFPFSKNNTMKVNQLESNLSINLSLLPQTLQKLVVAYKGMIIESEYIYLPELHTLQLFDYEMVSHISYFKNCINLVDFKFVWSFQETIYLHLEQLPKSVNRITLKGNIEIVRENNMPRSVDQLALHDYSFDEMERISETFFPKTLVLSFQCYVNNSNGEKFNLLLTKPNSRVIAGAFYWEDYDTFLQSPLSKVTDELSQYYMFQNSRGKSITKDEFEKFIVKNVNDC